MILKSGKWCVYDIIIEGISLVKNYRSQFKRILKKKSPEGMLEVLRKKVSKAYEGVQESLDYWVTPRLAAGTKPMGFHPCSI